MLVQNQAPGGEGSTIPPEPQPTLSTSQPIVSEPPIESLQIETPPTASPQTEAYQTAISQIFFHDAQIKKILPSPTTYQRKRKTQKCRGTKKDTKLPQTSVPLNLGADETRSERVLEQPNEPPLSEGHTSGSEEGSMEHTFELTDNVPLTPHDSPLVLDLENEKDAQAVEILNLKKRVKKLERKTKSSISQSRRRIYRQVESSDDDLDKEDASKQGRRSDKTKPMFKDRDFDELEDVEVNAAEQITTTGPLQVSTARPTVSIARPEVSAASVHVDVSVATPVTPPTTTTIFDDDEDLTFA
ncbi:hypothetical protein Tco_1332709 [Tanacetum coccineum]